MSDIFFENIIKLREDWNKYKCYFKEVKVPAKTILLSEGEISRKMFFIKEGCLRMLFNQNGKDITFQFFFENQVVSSVESFVINRPSQFSIEAIEPSVLQMIYKNDFEKLVNEIPEFREQMHKILIARISHYANLFLSFIRDSPQQRYKDLLKNQPHIIQRIPQHYIASYLGITSVSLSRIRNRILRESHK